MASNSTANCDTVNPFVSGTKRLVKNRKNVVVATKIRNVYGCVYFMSMGNENATNQLATQLMNIPSAAIEQSTR